MNATALAALVDRGIVIKAQMKTLAEELKTIEAKLKAAGLESDHAELKDASREGRQFLARGSRSIVPVIFTADLLVKSFAPESVNHRAIEAAAGAHFAHFFALKPTYETLFDDGKTFRTEADRMLGEAAPPFITACLQRGRGGVPKSAVKVEWEQAMAAEGHAAAGSEAAK